MRSLQIYCDGGGGGGGGDDDQGLRPAVILLLAIYDVAVDKSDFASVQSPD